MNPPLNEMITFLDEKGFDVQPVKNEIPSMLINHNKPRKLRGSDKLRTGAIKKYSYSFIIWKEDKILKEGIKRYADWQEGQKEVYGKLFNALHR